MSDTNTPTHHHIAPQFSPREIIFRYVRYLPWVVISISLALLVAYVKLRYSTTIYSATGKLLVTNSTPNMGRDKFDDIFMGQRVEKLNDEIEIIRSRNMALRVVRSLGLQKQVYNKGNIRSSAVHPSDVPFNFDILSITDSVHGFSVLITFAGDNEFRINELPQKHFYNETVTLPSVIFRITPNGKSRKIFSSDDFIVGWQPAENIAPSLSGSINVGRVSEVSNVLGVTYMTENPRMGKDIVNQYMKEYQQSSLEDKKQIAAQILEFIDEQLATVFQELGGVEKNLQRYREKNKVIMPDVQAQLSLNEYSQGNNDQSKLEVKVKVTDYMVNYLSDESNRFRMIPSVLGIEEPTLVQQVSEFNKLQLERVTALGNTARNNPRILAMDAGLEKLRLDMIETLKNVRQTQMMSMEQLSGRTQESNRMITAIPSKEKQMTEVTRQQGILQELYSYLLQKKLETAIASASTISSIKVVEPAIESYKPVSPNKKAAYIIALLIGAGLPIGIIFLKEYLDDKVKGKNDVQQNTDAPVLGEIGHAEEGTALVVTQNNRKVIAEQFRIIRSNLQYILPKVEKPILLVTSSFSGEGKSFISTNLGAVLALSGKRTVILEFDIRKPKIMSGLGLNERKGITNYIVGHVDLQEIIYPVPEVQNLFVIPCGPVPPNPAEMLLNEKVDQLFADLRKRFDAIIVDTAPVGLVSDAITLGRYADSSVYIVRHGYTLKKQVNLIDDLYQHNKLPHLSIIINDIRSDGGYGGYSGYGGYGYGYGYGYGMNGSGSYFENGSDKPKGWRKWLPASVGKKRKTTK